MRSSSVLAARDPLPAGWLLGLALAALALPGCGGGGATDAELAPQEQEDIVITPEMMLASETVFDPQITDGEALFKSYCAKCHGLSGTGNGPSAGSLSTQTGMNLTLVQLKTDEELYQTISAGRGVEMPPWGLVLTADQRRALLAHVRTFAPE